MSSDAGQNWISFQLNLPQVPITDLALKDNDLIVATQGRSFWVLDDLDVLWQSLEDPVEPNALRLFQPHPTVGFGGGNGKASDTRGTNHPAGVRMWFQLPDDYDTATLTFKDAEGDIIRSFATAESGEDALEANPGLNHFEWDLRCEKADDFEGLLMWWGTLRGPVVPPGTYSAELIADEDTVVTTFEILLDPRAEGTAADRTAQFEFLKAVRDKVDETHDAIRHMRATRGQISALVGRLEREDHPELFDASDRLDSSMVAIEEVLYQTKLKSNQDMLNYPIKLNNKLAHVGSLASMGIYRPTDQMEAVRQDISAKIDVELTKWYALRDEQLPAFNALIRSSEIEFIEAPTD